MKAIIAFIYILLVSCSNSGEHTATPKVESKYPYVQSDNLNFDSFQHYYVPIYSSIYGETGEGVTYLAATLSIRNMSLKDTLYATKVDYYGSRGELIKKYLDRPIILKPMTSVEFLVERDERKGGIGANFVVECAGNNVKNEPLIQAVMTGNVSRMAFAVNAIKLPK